MIADKEGAHTVDSVNRINKMISLILNPPDLKLQPMVFDIVYSFEGTKLRRYRSSNRNPDLAPVIFVYALINKPSILDLESGKSVVEKYLEAGYDVYMIDWNHPSEADRYTTISDYVNRYIKRMIKKVKEISGKENVNLFGYCMGGTFSAMYAALYPEDIKTLTIMAAPIAFPKKVNALLHILPSKETFPVKKIADSYHIIPPSFFNSAFFLLDPVRNSLTKYMEFYDMLDDDKKLMNFLRMEFWVDDGIYMPGEVYREFLDYGYIQNLLIEGKWKVGDSYVDLTRITMPTMILVASNDNIVDPESTKPLYDIIKSPDKKIIVYPTGHIGLAVSGKTHNDMWPAVIGWTNERSISTSDKKKGKKQK